MRRNSLVWFILRPCQHDDGYIDGRSQIKVHTDERTQVHSARASVFPDGHPSKYLPRSTLLNFSERATELALVAKMNQGVNFCSIEISEM